MSTTVMQGRRCPAGKYHTFAIAGGSGLEWPDRTLSVTISAPFRRLRPIVCTA